MIFKKDRLESIQAYHWLYPATEYKIVCEDCGTSVNLDQMYCEKCLVMRKELENERE